MSLQSPETLWRQILCNSKDGLFAIFRGPSMNLDVRSIRPFSGNETGIWGNFCGCAPRGLERRKLAWNTRAPSGVRKRGFRLNKKSYWPIGLAPARGCPEADVRSNLRRGRPASSGCVLLSVTFGQITSVERARRGRASHARFFAVGPSAPPRSTPPKRSLPPPAPSSQSPLTFLTELWAHSPQDVVTSLSRSREVDLETVSVTRTETNLNRNSYKGHFDSLRDIPWTRPHASKDGLAWRLLRRRQSESLRETPYGIP
jgi:hypothetical protein